MAATLRQRNVERSASPVSFASSDSEDDVETFSPPNFTIKELLDAIPKHCFEKSAFRSLSYVAMDAAFMLALGTCAYNISTFFGPRGSILSGHAGVIAKWAAWATYWWFQGLVMTGVWIIAHECGHQSFSNSKKLNNAVGWVLHSIVLVPYHSWRISHAKHHAATGHCNRDEVFVPRTASDLGINKPEGGFEKHAQSWASRADDLLEDSPLYILAAVLGQQLFGFPAYLIRNASGQRWYKKQTNHFNPNSEIFSARHWGQVLWSDFGLALVIGAAVYAAKQTSFSTVMAYYGIPYLAVNHWLVLITFLQHTDPILPHYRAGEYTWTRGALCTQDRNIHNFLTHSIANTHVLHHINSSIPHYHAGEATEALKKVLGPHYLYTDEHWLVSLWKCFNHCRFVDDEGEVVFYRNAKGEAKRRVAYEASSDSGIEVADK